MLNHCASEGREKKNAERERANEEWRKEGRDKNGGRKEGRKEQTILPMVNHLLSMSVFKFT